MKHMKQFENFQTDDKMSTCLKRIIYLCKEEVLGAIEHASEYFGDGNFLRQLEVNDMRIKNILNKVANLCEDEIDGSAEHISEIVSKGDCDYIADFLGIERIDFDSDDDNFLGESKSDFRANVEKLRKNLIESGEIPSIEDIYKLTTVREIKKIPYSFLNKKEASAFEKRLKELDLNIKYFNGLAPFDR